jgi:hypothetical protein
MVRANDAAVGLDEDSRITLLLSALDEIAAGLFDEATLNKIIATRSLAGSTPGRCSQARQICEHRLIALCARDHRSVEHSWPIGSDRRSIRKLRGATVRKNDNPHG